MESNHFIGGRETIFILLRRGKKKLTLLFVGYHERRGLIWGGTGLVRIFGEERIVSHKVGKEEEYQGA